MHYLEQELKAILTFDSQFFKLIHEGILDGFWYWDLEDPSQEWFNDKFWRTFGLEPREQQYSPAAWQDLVHPEDAALAQELIAAHLAEPQRPYTQHLRFRHKEGHWVHIHCTGQALLNDEGKPYRMLGIHLDVSQRERGRRALNRQKELRELLLEISAQFIDLRETNFEQLVDRTLARLGEFTQADRVYIFDYEAESGLTSNTFEWCGEGIEAQIANLQKVPLSYFPEWVEMHFKGESLFLPNIDALDPEQGQSKAVLQEQGIKSLLAVPIFLKERYIGFVGFDWVRDYTQFNLEEEEILRLFANMLGQWQWRMEQESELRSEQELSAQIVEELAFPVLILSPKGRVLRYNQSFLKLLGRQAQAPPLGSTVQSFFRTEDSAEMERGLQKAFSEGQASCSDLRLQFGAEEEIPVDVLARGLKDGQSKPLRLLLTIQDARPDQALQRKLAEQSRLLEALRDRSPILIVELNTQWQVLRVNPRMEELISTLAEGESIDFAALAQAWEHESEAPLISRHSLAEQAEVIAIEWHFNTCNENHLAFGLDVSQREKQRRQAEKQDANLRLAQSLAKLGSWEEDLVNEHFYASTALYRIYERSETQPFSIEARYEGIHPEDRAQVQQMRELALERQMEYYSVHRLLIGGREKYVEERALVDWGPEGQACSLYGFTQDVTEVRLQSLASKRNKLELEQIAQNEAFRASLYKLLSSDRPWPTILKSLQKRIGQFLGLERSAYYEIQINEAGQGQARAINRWMASSYASEAPPLKPLRRLDTPEWQAEISRWQSDHVHYYAADEAKSLLGFLYPQSGFKQTPELLVLSWTSTKEGIGLLLLAMEGSSAISNHQLQMLTDASLQLEASFRAQQLQREQALAMQRFETVAQLSSQLIYEFNFAEHKTYYSQSLLLFFGLEEVPREHQRFLADRLHSKDKARIIEGFRMLLEGGEEQWQSSYRLRKANNDYAIIHDEATLLRDERGEPSRLIGRLTDRGDLMSDQLLLEEAARFAAFGAWQIDHETLRVQHTEQINRILDRPLGQSIQLGSTNTMVWSDFHESWMPFGQIVQGNLDDLESFSNRNIKIRSEKGREKWVRLRVKAEREGVQIKRYYGIIQDVTAEVESNQKQEKANFWLDESQRVARVGHFIMNLAQQSWEASPYIYELLALPPDYPNSFDNWMSLLVPSYRERTKAIFDKAVANELPQFETEYQMQGLDGQLYWCAVMAEVKRDAAGQPQKVLGTLRDITREKHYLLSIENQNKHLREIAWRQSHSMRAPLTRMMAMLQQMNDEPDPQVWREDLAVLQRSAEELDRELKDIVKKIEYTDARLVRQGSGSPRKQDEELQVLVVDDDPVILRLHQRLISKSGFAATPVSFGHGGELVQFLEANSLNSATHYLIFLDINMPEYDGWAVLDFLEAFPAKNQCTVVMLSSSSDKADMQRAYSYGRVYEYLEKPLSAQQLDRIKELGALRRFVV